MRKSNFEEKNEKFDIFLKKYKTLFLYVNICPKWQETGNKNIFEWFYGLSGTELIIFKQL